MTHERKRGKGSTNRTQPEKPAAKKRGEGGSYSPVKPFNRKKLMLQLVTVAAVAVAIAIGLSIFFKVDTISVSGLEKYNYETVREASGILEGDSLVFFSRAEVSSKIMQALPYVKSVRIGITLPGTVNIVVEEVAVTYAIADTQGMWWLISAQGTVLDYADAAMVNEITTITGVQLSEPEIGESAVAAESIADPNKPVTVTGADRLSAALGIMQALEKNEILGEFTSVDVTSPVDLQLWYGKDFQFCLGDSSELNLKLAYVKAALPKILEDYPPGSLDVSNAVNSGGFPFAEFN